MNHYTLNRIDELHVDLLFHESWLVSLHVIHKS